MPSRKSRSTGTRSSRSSAARTSSKRSAHAVASELETKRLAAELVAEFRARKGPRPRVILLGPLGAGKSTFARAMLDAFGTRREAEGSPTFAIAHEYVSTDGIRIVHADGYRLKSEAELEATGLLETLWDPEAVVLFEWMDLFPETADALARSELPCLTVRLAIVRGDGGTERRIEFERTGF